MIIVKIEGKETLEKGLKKLKRKFDKMGIVKELRRRKEFTKPSVRRRDEIKKGIYIEKLRKEME
jgi:small subunit ribosomal protein S21